MMELENLSLKTIFLQLITNEISEDIVKFSNDCVEYWILNQNISDGSRLKKWKKLSCEKFKIFLGILFFSEIGKYPNIEDHWSEEAYKCSKVKEYLWKNRFLDILSFLHVSKYFCLRWHWRWIIWFCRNFFFLMNWIMSSNRLSF